MFYLAGWTGPRVTVRFRCTRACDEAGTRKTCQNSSVCCRSVSVVADADGGWRAERHFAAAAAAGRCRCVDDRLATWQRGSIHGLAGWLSVSPSA